MNAGENVPGRDAEGALHLALVDDHEIVHEGLRAALSAHPDLRLEWACTTVPELLAATPAPDGHAPELVLLDLRLADGSSPELNVRALRDRGLAVVALTSAENPYLIRQAARAGVQAVLRKTEPVGRLVEAIRLAAAGSVVPSIEWAAALDSDPDLPRVGLSPRQQQVLSLYASGADASTVADELGIQPGTVPDYVARIRYRYAEAGRPAPSKTDLYKRALEDGYLPIPGGPE